jgi:hypothetical protein
MSQDARGGTGSVRRTMAALRAWWAPAGDQPERGDVPGWVLVTLMTAGLVVGLWTVAGDALENVFTEAMNRVLGV